MFECFYCNFDYFFSPVERFSPKTPIILLFPLITKHVSRFFTPSFSLVSLQFQVLVSGTIDPVLPVLVDCDAGLSPEFNSPQTDLFFEGVSDDPPRCASIFRSSPDLFESPLYVPLNLRFRRHFLCVHWDY